MDSEAALAFSIALLAVVGLWLYVRIHINRNKGQLPLPPGPQGLPFVGTLLSLEPDLHRYYAKLSQTYGPIIKLRLGSKTVVVASSPSTAKEVLKDHDAIFANRDLTIVASAASYGAEDMAFAPYGPTWRMLRKVCVRDIMGKKNLDGLYQLRRSEVRKTVGYVNSKAGMPVSVGDQMFKTMLNLTMSMLWGGTLKGEERESVGAEFRRAVLGMLDVLSKPNISDFFPILAWFDLQGYERRTKRLSLWFDRIYDPIINQRLRMDAEDEGNDLLQILLRLKEEDSKTPLTLTNISSLRPDLAKTIS